MRLALLYRLAIPLLLTLASTAIFFRALMLLLLAITFTGLVLLVYRLTGRTGQTTKDRGKFIESSYKVVDDNEEPSEK